MNKKAFTLVEMLAIIMVLGIILSIATAFYNSYLLKSRVRAFKIAESSLVNAAKEINAACVTYGTSCGIVENGKTISLSQMIELGFIEEINNPYNTNEKCSTNSYVSVSEENISNDGISNYTYDVCLICGSNRSEFCN